MRCSRWGNQSLRDRGVVVLFLFSIMMTGCQAKKQKKERVFWELREERDGFASKVSRHFNERFLPAVGVWERYTKVLYCTRHTFINKLYSEKVDENIIKMLVGHEKEFTMKHYGGDPFTPEVLLEEISKVNYSKINWKKLKI